MYVCVSFPSHNCIQSLLGDMRMNPLAFLRRPHCTNWCHSLGKPPVVYKPGSFLWGIAILYIYIYICIRSQFPTRTTLVCKQRVVSPKNGTNWCNVAFSEKPKGSSACPQEEIGCNCGWERTHTHTHIYIL